MIERLNELNEKYEIDPEALEAALAFLDCGDHPKLALAHEHVKGHLLYSHAIRTLFGMKSDGEWSCELAELPNWDIRIASPMSILTTDDFMHANCGHLYFTLKGERRVDISMKLELKTNTWRADTFYIEAWPFGDLQGCHQVQEYSFDVDEKTKTDVFDFLKKLEAHECDEYCNSEKFPYDEEE